MLLVQKYQRSFLGYLRERSNHDATYVTRLGLCWSQSWLVGFSIGLSVRFAVITIVDVHDALVCHDEKVHPLAQRSISLWKVFEQIIGSTRKFSENCRFSLITSFEGWNETNRNRVPSLTGWRHDQVAIWYVSWSFSLRPFAWWAKCLLSCCLESRLLSLYFLWLSFYLLILLLRSSN